MNDYDIIIIGGGIQPGGGFLCANDLDRGATSPETSRPTDRPGTGNDLMTGKPVRVFWIGASSTNQRLFRVTEAMVQAGGETTIISTRARVPHKKGDTSLTDQIRDGRYDVVILQC